MHLRFVITALAAASAIAAPNAGAKPAPPAPPPSLSGEAFAGTPTITSASCNPAGNSTFTYHIEGGAFGPYPGTFEETGTVVVGPQLGPPPSAGFPLVSIEATFTIDSPTGQVEGTKSLRPGSLLAFGVCLDSPTAIRYASAATLDYTATITTATGKFRDEGTSNIGSVGSISGGELGFSEGFLSELLAPILLKPGKGCGDENHAHERRDECKK